MKKIPNYLLVLFASLAFICGSCEGSCYCSKELGCTIATALKMSDGSIVAQQKFCSTVNFQTDAVRQDSLAVFRTRYTSGQVQITTRDSMYYYQFMDNVKTKDTHLYTNTGYHCNCNK